MIRNPGKALRELLGDPGIVMMPGVFDGISARVAEQAGFKALYLTGAGASASGIGEPDIGLATMNDFADNARRITIKANIPAICDADTGFGNQLNVIRTVHEFEAAGIAAVQMEDQVSPKRCGHLAGKQVVSAGEFAQKIRAAVNEKFFPDTMIVARTDARAVYSMEETLDRCKMYMDAGADILFVEALTTIDEVELVGRELGGQIKLMANQVLGGKTPRLSAAELEQLGYKIVIFPDVLPYGASVLLREICDNIMKNGTGYDAIPGNHNTSLDLFLTMGMRAWREKESQYKEEI
ncbi:MAG: oxaloacetate decarboxylase [Candidatus Limivicinus sp.]|nr:oxaloacetate decarboxylase [Candidatus Limivicinus sp.]